MKKLVFAENAIKPLKAKIFNRLTETAAALKPKYQTGRAFHVTFIMEKSRVLSIGINNFNKTHPKTREYNYIHGEKIGTTYVPCLHSEMDAWLKLGESDCSKYNFINVRINNNGELDYSFPCFGCRNLLKQTGFKNLFYSTKEGVFKRYEA